MIPADKPKPNEDDLPPEGEADSWLLWTAEMAIVRFEAEPPKDPSEVRRARAALVAGDLYRMIHGMTADIEGLDEKPDPVCVQSKLPKGRRPKRKEYREAIRACRKKKS
jgi:hypothetical protein